MFVIPVRPEMVRHVLDDLPVGPAPFERLEDLIEPLNSPLGAGERAFLFQARGGGQHDVGESAGVAEEDVLNDEEIKLGECILDVVRVGIDQAHFLAEQIHRLELAGVNGVDHLVIVEPFGGRAA